jgi:hypothetical protein
MAPFFNKIGGMARTGYIAKLICVNSIFPISGRIRNTVGASPPASFDGLTIWLRVKEND